MYKGKFNQKGKSEAVDVQQLLAQREAANAAAQREAASAPRRPAPRPQPSDSRPAAGSRPAPNGQAPARPRPDAANRPVQNRPRPAPVPQAPVKKGPRLGGVIFYTLYFMYILVFCAGTFLAMLSLRSWLVEYEASQPSIQAEAIFNQLFANPDWNNLYAVSGIQDSPYEGQEDFALYMSNKVGSTPLTYRETSAGLGGGMKYQVLMGDEQIATFTMKDLKLQEKLDKQATNVGGLDLAGLTHVADWELDQVELFFQKEGTYRIEKLEGHTVYVNDVALDDSFTIQKASTVAEEYLPTGTVGYVNCTQEVSGLMNVPTVTIFDREGNQLEVFYNAETQTFSERADAVASITPEEAEAARGAAESFCKWMIKEITDRGSLGKYYDPTGKAYQSILSATTTWAQDNNGFEFVNEEVTNYVKYSDTLFSCRVTLQMKLQVVVDGSEKTFPYDQYLFFRKNDQGKWLCYDSTNRDVSAPVGQVRLTFMNDGAQVTTDFYSTDAKEIVVPLISPIPEGKVFTGWYLKEEDSSGRTTLTRVFQPDETGKVVIPEGYALTPMVLHAHFEDAAAAAAAQPAPAETSAAATEGG